LYYLFQDAILKKNKTIKKEPPIYFSVLSRAFVV
jgi:hypothetical protein